MGQYPNAFERMLRIMRDMLVIVVLVMLIAGTVAALTLNHVPCG